MNISTDKKTKYFVVGSAVELAIEDEPREGWIRVYEIVDQGGRRQLRAYSEDKISGSVYCVDECDGKLVCGIGSTVPLLSQTFFLYQFLLMDPSLMIAANI